ncbi:MAG: SAF domain-containing protein, partial [Pontimonas sp.]
APSTTCADTHIGGGHNRASVEREQRKAAVAERMSDNTVRSRLRATLNEPVDGDVAVSRTPRRLPEMLIGMVLVVGGALGGVVVFQRSSDRVVVVGAAHDLSRGTILTRSDVIAVEVGSLPSGAAVPGTEAGSLLGQRLLVDLPAGVPISPQIVASDELLGPNEALIPVALERGAVPSGLGRGDVVRVVISYPNHGGEALPPQVLGDVVEVFDFVLPDEFGNAVEVTLRADTDIAVDLARADRIQLLKVADR